MFVVPVVLMRVVAIIDDLKKCLSERLLSIVDLLEGTFNNNGRR